MQELLESAHAELLALFPGRRVSLTFRVANCIPGEPTVITLYAILYNVTGDDCDQIATGNSIAQLMQQARDYASRGN